MFRFMLAGFVAFALPGMAVAGQEPVHMGTLSDLAVNGYDPVVYFTEGKPVEGSGEYSHEWQGATWRFTSAIHLNRFKADPARYAPQFGGYCAWAVSQDYTASADPAAWRIFDGRLYLNYDLEVQKTWEQDVPGTVAKGQGNWPRVLEK